MYIFSQYATIFLIAQLNNEFWILQEAYSEPCQTSSITNVTPYHILYTMLRYL